MSVQAPVLAKVPWATLAVAAVLTVAPLVAFLAGDPTVKLIVLIVLAMAAAAYAATIHPMLIFSATAGTLGFVPYLDIPGTNVPVLLALAVGTWVALAFLPGVQFRPGWCEWWVLSLAAAALLSVVATDRSVQSLTELVAWVAATAIVVPVRFLPPLARATMVRVFVLSSAAASLLGILLVWIDPDGVLLSRLAFAGYSNAGTNVQRVAGTETLTTRLTGTFVEPNIAGLILAIGLLLAVGYFRGPMRVLLVVVVGTGLMLTLSRAAIATVVVAGVLLVVRSGGTRRLGLLMSGTLASVGALTIPGVRSRLFDSFGPSDTGTIVRDLAFQQFPLAMEGHWLWGVGWAREEFRDASLGRIVNFVANAPLLTIYRGGLILGALAIAALVVLVITSWAAAKRSFEDAVVCCGVIGMVLVAMQLDFPVVVQVPATVAFSFLVGLSLHPPDPRVPKAPDD
jgi:hypothetical protein